MSKVDDFKNRAFKKYDDKITHDNWVNYLIQNEQYFGFENNGEYASMHEAYAVIKEELEEFWQSVKENDPDPMELLQVCATARRAMMELCGIK